MRTSLIVSLALALTGVVAAVSTGSAQEQAAVIATDYNSVAHVTGLELAAPWTVAPLPGEPVYHDAVARWHDGLVWVVNRAGADNVQVLDPAQGFATVRQFGLGLGRNIQDIGFAPDGTAYVSCYDTAELLHVDPQAGDILQVISTAGFADADGLPETGWLHVRDDHLFVTCQRLDRDAWYAPVGDSYLLVLDLATQAWIDCDPAQPGVQGILLAATNPGAPIQDTGDHLLVALVGHYGLQDGGVDVIDPQMLASLGLEIGEADLGGDLVALAATGATRHVVVADATWVTHVRRYEPGVAPTTVLTGAGYDHAAIAWDGDAQLLVADRRLGHAGVRVLDAASGVELTDDPIDVGLPPGFIAVPATGPVSVGDAPAVALALAPPWPNPANPATRIAFDARPGQTVTLRVLDLRGRTIREARVVADRAGEGRWTFDGRDTRGRAVSSGVYRCVVQTPGAVTARSFTVVR